MAIQTTDFTAGREIQVIMHGDSKSGVIVEDREERVSAKVSYKNVVSGKEDSITMTFLKKYIFER